MVKCSKCNTENEENAVYCHECGKMLNITEEKLKKNTLSFASIKWPLVLPVALAIGLIGLAVMGAIFLLIIILALITVGYLVKEPKIGALNGLITGIISFSIGGLSEGLSMGGLMLLGSIIVFAIGGALFGAIFGGLGGYIKKIK